MYLVGHYNFATLESHMVNLRKAIGFKNEFLHSIKTKFFLKEGFSKEVHAQNAENLKTF